MKNCPECGGAVINLVEAGTRALVGHHCAACNKGYELCLTKKSDGSLCRRLASECTYHGEEE